MGENGERHGRNVGYGWRGRIAALSGVGVMSVTLIMMLSPAAAAVSAGTVYVAPYKGVTAPSNNFNLQNCAHVKNVKAMKVSLKTGVGIVANTGGTKACKGLASSLSSYANDYNNFEVAIPVKIGSSATSVAVNSAWKVTGTASATAGGKHPACAGGSSYSDTYTYENWGYTGSYFPYYNDTYNYSGHTYSYGYAAPSPFNFNNTSSYSYNVDYGAYSSCSVMAEWAITSNAHLLDATTGTTTNWDASSVPVWVSVGEVEISQSVDWYCYGTPISWYGPSGTWSNTTVSCYSYNTTLTSLIFNGTSTTGTSTSLTYSNTTAGSGAYWFNSTTASTPGAQTFNPTDSYDVIVEVANDMNIAGSYSYYYAGSWEYGYPAGSASWSLNMATLGNGWDLKSITVT